MAATMETEVRAFAAEFPTANVRRMVALAEADTITWADAYRISRQALAAGLVDGFHR